MFGRCRPKVDLRARTPILRPARSRWYLSTQIVPARQDYRGILIKSSIAVCFLFASLLAASADATTLTVNSTGDDGTGTCTLSKCTLRDAVLSTATADTINFSLPANSAITLTNGELLINKNLTISGPGARLLTVQRSAASGTPQFRIFEILATFSATISGMTMVNGSAPGGTGGGINNSGLLTINNSIIVGNSASLRGGGISNNGFLTINNSTISRNSSNVGGGIWNTTGATVNLVDSTISDNDADFGGGIDSGGTSHIFSSTISGNSAFNGGGITNNPGGVVTLTNSTVTANTASEGGSGGGIANNGGTISARNTIIALNTAPTAPDVSKTLNSQGYNLIGNNAGATITPTTGDQIGTAALPVNPLLGPLQDNGGGTNTHALLTGSRAIDKGNSPGSSSDQRGFPRRVDSPVILNAGDGSDIGAYEVQPDQLAGCSEINLVVNNNSDGSAGSLRSVIANACGSSTITFAANVRGAINLTSGELLINKNLTITGPGLNLLSVQRSAASGTPDFRVFNIAPSSDATISGLTIANGNTPGTNGGGIYNNGGTLTVSNSTLSGNAASGGAGGGAIANSVGTVTITNSTLSGNSAGFGGGGINNFRGTVTLINSTISGNTTSGGHGGGIYNSGDSGTDTVVVTNSTISGNTASHIGLGIGLGGGIYDGGGRVTVINSTISGNTAQFRGGGITTNGTLRANNTIIALNTSPTGPDVYGVLNSQGFNVVGIGLGASITAQPTDQIGATAAQLNLGPLQNNGGPTQTHALLSASIAIDKGQSFGATTDQRGFTRPVDLPGTPNGNGGDGSDIGAFEVQALAVAATVVEFVNTSLDHYFITWVADEIAKLDAGTVIKGWTRTGRTLKTYTTPQSGTSPVCRYYIPPGLGDSHFFGRGTAECNATGQNNPSFVLEDPAFMQMFLPVGGNCPAGTTQVYRVFSNRLDANHRYMADKAVRDQMVAMGWLVEGDGPDAVVMCAPQ